jgi:hypothetical protein
VCESDNLDVIRVLAVHKEEGKMAQWNSANGSSDSLHGLAN